LEKRPFAKVGYSIKSGDFLAYPEEFLSSLIAAECFLMK
jgi:hypothetical protein